MPAARASAYVYWSHPGGTGGEIGRANNLTGGGVDQSFITNVGVGGLAVDASHIYWTNSSSDEIGRANLEGTDVDPDFISATSPSSVAVDDQFIYWTNTSSDTIARADLDGGNVNQSLISGANSPNGLAVDEQHVFWTNFSFSSGSLGRANVDGSNVNQNFIATTVPLGLAADDGGLGTASRAPQALTSAPRRSAPPALQAR